MATTITVNQGDYGSDATLAFTLTDPDATIMTLSGYSIYLLVYSDPANPIINGTCVFDSGLTFHYVPVLADFAKDGNYKYEIEIDKLAGRLSGTSGNFVIQASPTH